MCHRQSSSGSSLWIAQVIPPWAETVCDLVGNTFEITAVFNPDSANCREALIPEPPPPMIIPSKSLIGKS